jgi:8-oxo-dGTP pyrophosphatase MutT (NUDIX family)
MVSGQPYYLITQRRDSYAYIDFLLGNYNPANIEAVKTLFSKMTAHERFRIMRHSFLSLWKDFLFDKPFHSNRQRYILCHEKYARIKGVIDEVMKVTSAMSRYPEWGFPKGRKQKGEMIEDAAYREFLEETMFDGNIKQFDRNPLTEVYKGTDEKTYKTCYWVYDYQNPLNTVPKPTYIHLENNIRTYSISDEVSCVKWVTSDMARRYLAPRHIQILKAIDKRVLENVDSNTGSIIDNIQTCRDKVKISPASYWSSFQIEKIRC